MKAKEYYFTGTVSGDSRPREYVFMAGNLESALRQLSEKLVSNNEPFRIDVFYYAGSAERIPSELYNKYLTGYSF